MPESGQELERRAEALYLERDYAAAAAHYERAYAAYRKSGDRMEAGRAARSAAWITGNVLGDWAVLNGWFARALTVLEGAGDEGPERGWVLIIRSISESDAPRQEALLRDAVAIGHRVGDPDIEFVARGYLGGLLLMTDRIDEGLDLLDEVMAATCAGELTEVASEDRLFCGFFWACELVNDVPRADQWMRAAADLLNRRNDVAAFCRAHYGGILTAAGRWDEAETELLAASSHFEREKSTRREGALIRLAALRVRQGRLEEAAQLLTGLEAHRDAAGALASLHLARGDTAIARDLLERATAGSDDVVPEVGAATMVGPLLALLVEVHLAEHDVDAAAQAAERLSRVADAQGGAYLQAAAALAKGQVCIGSGEGDGRACLQVALEGFVEAQMPMELARTRLEMARWSVGTSPEVAIAEAKLALEGFERLDAAAHADAAAQLLRSLGAPGRTGPKGVGALTKREAEVLQLLGAGLSNPEIADRLYITRKTAEHHVGRVLAKLGVRNRAEAAVVAARENIRHER
jgi:DNA-binding CsgD family transcriptional regulator